jgi:hypothetical protein
MTSWEEAVAAASGDGTPSAPAHEVVGPAAGADTVTNPQTGEVLDVAGATTTQLTELVLACRAREADITTWRRAAEDEIRVRLEAEGRRVAVVGDYELEISSGRGRAWDADELDGVLRDLVHRGIVTVSEVADVIHREFKVDGRAAARLLGALDGEAKAEVEQCFRWEQKGRPRLTITPSIQLEAPK